MKKFSLFLIVCIAFASCKTKINQYIKNENNVNQRTGKWKEEYFSDEGTLVAIGRYKKNEKIGTWRTTFQNKLYQKDVIKKEITKTKVYFPNGKIMEKGQSRLDISESERHWYYFGDWKYFDEKGQLLYIKKYEKGKKMDSISYQKN